MSTFNFDVFSVNNVLTSLLNSIPVSVTSFNFLIIGNTILLPLGDYPRNSLTAVVGKKDTTADSVFSATTVQDGSTIISQPQGNTYKISSSVSIPFFTTLFGGVVNVPAAGVVDTAFSFAYDNFKNTNCVIIDQTGIKGVGKKRLKIANLVRTADPKDADRITLDVTLNAEYPAAPAASGETQVDEAAVIAALGA